MSDAAWRVELTQAAQRDLRRLDPPIRGRVATALGALAEDPQKTRRLAKAHERARVEAESRRLASACSSSARRLESSLLHACCRAVAHIVTDRLSPVAGYA